MISTANDPRMTGGGPAFDWAMTVVELAIFIAVYRAAQPIGADVLSNILGRWFESVVGPDDIAGAVTNMVERGWLVMIGGRLMATQDGRRVASHLMNGVIRMLDQGTRLIDVALMMSVLRLTKGELDNGNL